MLILALLFSFQANACDFLRYKPVITSFGRTELQFQMKKADFELAELESIDFSKLKNLHELRKLATAEVKKFGQSTDDPLAMMEWQIKKYHSDDARYLQRLQLLASGAVGKVERISCFEALMMNLHFSIQDRAYGNEFMMNFMVKDDDLIVDFVSSGLYGMVSSDTFEDRLNLLHEQGWTLIENFHSHPFVINAKKDPAGSILPSGFNSQDFADLNFYKTLKHLGLREVRVTNGFFTSVIRADKLDLFP